MRSTIPLGSIAGIRLGANWSWLLIFALITWTLAMAVFPQQSPGLAEAAYWAMGVVAAVLFFGSIVLHELGHALQARRDDVEIEGITLWLFGGVAQFRGMYGSPGAEFRIAVAGPAVTVVIAVALLAAAALIPLPEAVDAVVAWVGTINVALLVFNLLPALPLDGGRILHAALWRRRDDLASATQTAAAIGVLFGGLLIAGGVFLFFATAGFGGLWLAFIGWFLTMAARAEAGQVLVRQALRGLTVGDVMSPDPLGVPPDASLQTFVDEYAGASRYTTYPVVEGGRPVGLLPFDEAMSVPRDEWRSRSVRDVMVPEERMNVLSASQDAREALEQLGDGEGRGVVVDDGRLVGMVSPADLARAVSVRGPDVTHRTRAR